MAPFVKLFDALNTPESLFIFRGTGRGGRVKKVGVHPEYPDRTGAAVLGQKKKGDLVKWGEKKNRGDCWVSSGS